MEVFKMFKSFIMILGLAATMALYGCGGGGGGGGTSNTLVQLLTISVTPTDSSVVIGGTKQFTATGIYTDNSTKDLTSSVTWSSSSTSIATIGTDGKAIAVNVGQTTITATLAGGTTGSTKFIVTDRPKVIAGVANSPGSANGSGSAALFNDPEDINTDGTNLYVVDTGNHNIRAVGNLASTVNVTTLAGLPYVPPAQAPVDGTGTAAIFNPLYGITIDGNKANLYVTETNMADFSTAIRKVEIATKVVTTIVAALPTASALHISRGITMVGTDLYVCDVNNDLIYKIDTSTSPATVSSFTFAHSPMGITNDGTNLYVTSYNDHVIEKIVISSKARTVLAGTLSAPGFKDGIGVAAQFNAPQGITRDGDDLYVADYLNGSIRKIKISTGEVATVVTFENQIKPHGITRTGTTLYTSNNDHTITSILSP
jgi:hypothetical protein